MKRFSPPSLLFPSLLHLFSNNSPHFPLLFLPPPLPPPFLLLLGTAPRLLNLLDLGEELLLALQLGFIPQPTVLLHFILLYGNELNHWLILLAS